MTTLEAILQLGLVFCAYPFIFFAIPAYLIGSRKVRLVWDKQAKTTQNTQTRTAQRDPAGFGRQ